MFRKVNLKYKNKNPETLVWKGFQDLIFLRIYSHSMVPVGLGVRSHRTRLTPETS